MKLISEECFNDNGDEFLYDFIVHVQHDNNLNIEDKLQTIYKAAFSDKDNNEGVAA